MLYPEIFIDVDFDIDFYIEDTVISYPLAISIFLIYRSNWIYGNENRQVKPRN